MFVREPDFRADAPQGLFLSRHGNWFHDGDQLHHRRMCALLHRSITRIDEILVVTTGRDRLEFVAEGAPFTVTQFHQGPLVDKTTPTSAYPPHGAENPPQITFVLSDDDEEALTTAHQFAATPDGALYVSVKKHHFWAALTSGAQQWLQPWWQEAPNDAFVLCIGEKTWPLLQMGDEFHPIAQPHIAST